MTDRQTTDYWQKKIAKYGVEEWADKASIFAETVAKVIPHNGKLLELGCGNGQDGAFFAGLGLKVTQTDIRDYRGSFAKGLAWEKVDMSKPLPFKTGGFDVVYAHLSIHYFSKARTSQLFAEIATILKPGGYFAFLVNSDQDSEFGTGDKIEDGLFKIGDIQKRFFTLQYAESLIKEQFEIEIFNDKGTSYKDRAEGNYNLIQFIGRKKS